MTNVYIKLLVPMFRLLGSFVFACCFFKTRIRLYTRTCAMSMRADARRSNNKVTVRTMIIILDCMLAGGMALTARSSLQRFVLLWMKTGCDAQCFDTSRANNNSNTSLHKLTVLWSSTFAHPWPLFRNFALATIDTTCEYTIYEHVPMKICQPIPEKINRPEFVTGIEALYLKDNLAETYWYDNLLTALLAIPSLRLAVQLTVFIAACWPFATILLSPNVFRPSNDPVLFRYLKP